MGEDPWESYDYTVRCGVQILVLSLVESSDERSWLLKEAARWSGGRKFADVNAKPM
ncbi:MAG: hypothetical protein QGG36_07570 [Pirellulaceae bacterium]|jgi:hypothetical protein|nr:hypothetical protein [Pirellulaceae bacterium]MDP7015642.1 hypothetical protein [Pirellulaceae bacterium]